MHTARVLPEGGAASLRAVRAAVARVAAGIAAGTAAGWGALWGVRTTYRRHARTRSAIDVALEGLPRKLRLWCRVRLSGPAAAGRTVVELRRHGV